MSELNENNKSLGELGEDIAVEFLQKKGYTILDRNWRSGRNELDIIAEVDNVLVVIEVKTRTYYFFDEVNSVVSRGKMKTIVKTTQDYFTLKQIEKEVRFDIILVIKNNKTRQIKHIENAFGVNN